MDVRTVRFFKLPDVPMPVYVHTVGYNAQKHMIRPEGFSAYQIMFARSGQGRFRMKGHAEFDFGPMEMLVLPPDLPHEYFPTSNEPWEIGYISFLGNKTEELLEHFSMVCCQPTSVPDLRGIWRSL